MGLKYISLNYLKIVPRLTEIFYPVAKMYFQKELHRKEQQSRHSPILIYQMGKVASKSIKKSLSCMVTNRNMYHFHLSHPESIKEHLGFKKQQGSPYRRSEYGSYWTAEYFRNKTQSQYDKNRYKIISLFREPISHNVSTFFQNCNLEWSNLDKNYKLKSDWYGFELSINEKNISNLVNIYNKKADNYWSLNYFDQEFKDSLGVDIYLEDFPKSKGYSIYQHEKFDVLLIKYENLNKVISKAFKDFLGVENFKLRKHNITKEKNYGEIYELFKNNIVVSEKILDEIYSSKYVKHFYSDEEIRSFKKKWTKRL